MDPGPAGRGQHGIPERITPLELPEQMGSFEPDLTPGNREAGTPDRSYFPAVKRVSPAFRFPQDLSEINLDRGQGPGSQTEPEDLGITAVAAGPALQDFFGQQSFPPDSGQTGGIQVTGMERPESHRTPKTKRGRLPPSPDETSMTLRKSI
jgi:hypothetical protein